jgi:hypothetical protein
LSKNIIPCVKTIAQDRSYAIIGVSKVAILVTIALQQFSNDDTMICVTSCCLPQEDVKFLGLHLDRRLTWHKHIVVKRRQIGIALTKMYWLLGRKSKFSTSNKLLIYKTVLKPIWTCGMKIWGTASTSNIEILERFQSKALCMIEDTPWYVPDTVIRRDLQTPTVKEEIRRYSSQYSARLSAHPNGLVVNLMEQPDNRRLRRHLPNDLPTRFLM